MNACLDAEVIFFVAGMDLEAAVLCMLARQCFPDFP